MIKPKTIVVRPGRIEFDLARFSRDKLIMAVCGPYELINDCTVPGVLLFCNRDGVSNERLSPNHLINPMIDVKHQDLMAKYGGPVGNIIITSSDERELPFDQIENRYLNSGEEWRAAWRSAVIRWNQGHAILRAQSVYRNRLRTSS